MKMSEIIEEVSKLYRSELSHRRELQDEYNDVVRKLLKADHERGENITLAEYQYLKARKIALQQFIGEADKYCEGVSDVREILMDLGFDTEVE